ncbi:hypothetical protein QZJ86_04240 [Methylomonas montana]|uniref:hypothetical protein n=1 Tax=Methylomonas montana TaxID=3058963 RepID=UPI0026599844|nr:hypothetical protein [Methylomonas montana]WKJ91345.1 hypothetical protein QZJ86_04240 [Methylomonas montana]
MKETSEQLVSRLDDAISGLKRLSPASLQFDSEMYEHFFKGMLLLQAFKAEFEGTSTEPNSPLIDTDLRIQVAAAIARLESEIDGTFSQADEATAEHARQVKECIELGMTEDQALEHCSVEILDSVVDELYTRAESMMTERNSLIAFIQDQSGDVRLLAGTRCHQPEPVSH